MNSNGENNVIVEVPAHEPEPKPVMTLRRAVTWIIAIFFVVFVAVGLLDRPNYDSKTVPQSLVGEWSSDHPDYTDRYLEISASRIIFGIGGTSYVAYSILGVEREQAEDLDIVILHFRDVSGTKFKRTAVLHSSGASMHFASQPKIIWLRYGS